MQHTGMAESYQLGVPHLQLGEVIGGGGFARVFHGYDTLLRRHLAVKILRPVNGVELRDMFEAEAAAHGALSRHPHIVTIHQVGWTVDGSRPFLVMDYVAGGSLADYLAARGPVPWQHAVAWMIPVCSAVQHAHDHGILHRDVKPDNILLESPGQPLLSDFGIACLRDDTSPLPAMSIGHAAPEALRGELRGIGSDVYSLASTLYHLLTGRLPFGGDPLARIHNAGDVPAPLPADRVPAWLDEAVRRAMAPDPAHRTFSARELARALEAGAGRATVFPSTVVAQPVAAVAIEPVDPRPRPAAVAALSPPVETRAASAAAPAWAGPTAGSGPASAVGSMVPWAGSTAGSGPASAAAPVAAWAGSSVTGPAANPVTPSASGVSVGGASAGGTIAAGAPAPTRGAARSTRKMTVAAVLSAVLALAATAAWARDGYLDSGRAAGRGTAVAGPSATAPVTVAVPATIGSEEATPSLSAALATEATGTAEATQVTGPTTPASVTPTPTRTPSSGTATSGTASTPTVGTRPVDGTDPGVVTDPPPPVQVTVPDVATRTVAEATATLTGAGLRVDPASVAATSCSVGSGKVMKTSPAAGASAAKGTSVKLTVSSGTPSAKVPATVGKTEQDAKTAFANAGFTVTVKAVYLPKGDADIGRVTAQSATAGTTASTCAAVVLTVGRQQLSIVSPDTAFPPTTLKLTGP